MPIAKPPLPKNWPRSVQSALMYVFSLAQYAMTYTRGWAVHCKNPLVRSKAELNQAHQEIALLREQIRILNARMEVIPPSSRPNYLPTERLAILELKAVRGWSLDKTAKAFLVTPATIASWMKRLDEQGTKALIQVPIGYWLAVVIDHYSRRVMGITAFKSQPTCAAVCGCLGRAIARAGKSPKYIVCDRGGQFDCDGFRKWCKRKGIKRPRYGKIGKHGSIAVVERAILTIKCLLHGLPYVSYRRGAFQRQLTATVEWYNNFRPHTWLGGKTPHEVYKGTFPANRRPRFEPRAKWPRGSPCAQPWALVRGSPGVKVTLDISFHQGYKHLPIVKLKRVA